MSVEKYGPFAAAFSSEGLRVQGYYELRLPGDEAQVVIDRIEVALQTGNSSHWIKLLLQQADWRPHLVAAIAYLLDGAEGNLDRQRLWKAMDGGSWVTPQLAVTAFFVDRDFALRVRERIEKHCPVAVPINLGAAERHSATGPAGVKGRRGKLAASLLALCPMVPALAGFEGTWRENPENRALLLEDASTDDSESWTLSWMEAVQWQFAKRGIELSPPKPL